MFTGTCHDQDGSQKSSTATKIISHLYGNNHGIVSHAGNTEIIICQGTDQSCAGGSVFLFVLNSSRIVIIFNCIVWGEIFSLHVCMIKVVSIPIYYCNRDI